MKKAFFAILLSAMVAANVSACNFVSKEEIKEPFKNTDTTELKIEETDENTTESETSVETKPAKKCLIDCNGLFPLGSKIQYTIDQNGDLSIHIPD